MKTSLRSLLFRCAESVCCALALATAFAQEVPPPGSNPIVPPPPPPEPAGAARVLQLNPLRVSYEAGVLFLGFATDPVAREVAIEYSLDLQEWVGAEAGVLAGGPPPPPPIEFVESLPRAPGQNLRILPLESAASGLGFYRTVRRSEMPPEAATASPVSSLAPSR